MEEMSYTNTNLTYVFEKSTYCTNPTKEILIKRFIDNASQEWSLGTLFQCIFIIASLLVMMRPLQDDPSRE